MTAVDDECGIIQTEADQVRVEKNYSRRLLWGRTTPKGVNIRAGRDGSLPAVRNCRSAYRVFTRL